VKRPLKIVSVSATIATADGMTIKHTAAVDELGQAWELKGAERGGGQKWSKLPVLPETVEDDAGGLV